MTPIPSTVISAEDLHARLGAPELRLFDCRFDLARPDAGLAAFRAGHLPGAVFADLNRDLSAPVRADSGRHPLPEPSGLERTLRRLGVNAGDAVVAYDDRNGMFASRLWWMLRWVGHDRVAVLDGGLARWTELGLPVTTAIAAPAPGDFVARVRPDQVVTAAEVARMAADPRSRVLDARAPERFRGDVEPIDPVAGHVPGAHNQPFSQSLEPDGRLRAPEVLRGLLAQALGNVAPEHTAAMCGSGVTACHLLLAMQHAGLGGGRLYAGSWSEWIRDASRPVARGG